VTQTVTGAVAVRDKQDQLIGWIRGQQAEIAMAAATHIKPSAVVRVAHGALRRNPKLMAAAIANPQSLLYALLDAARLGHEPDTDDYYLVPFGDEVQGIEGYKGIIERMFRAGAVSSVVAEIVRQRDVYRRQGSTTPPVHEFDEFADPEDRGPLRGAYAYAVMLDGRFSKVILMGRAEIMKHKAMSRGSHKPDSPWQQWEPAMWKKTVLRGLEPYVPTSTEYRTAAALLLAKDDRPAPPPSLPASEVVDAEVIEETSRQAPVTAAPGDGEGPEGAWGPAGPSPARAGGPGMEGGSHHGAAEPAAPGAETTNQPGPPPGHEGAGQTLPAAGEQREHDARPVPSLQPASKTALDKLAKLLKQIPLGTPDDVAVFTTWVTGIPAGAQLTRTAVTQLTSFLEDALAAAQGDGAEAASRIWQQYKTTRGEQASDG
jgi:recombination protein RecT